MTVAVLLVALALVDGAFSGFRASVGRTGLVEHRASDVRGAVRGARICAALAVPAVLACVLDVTLGAQAFSSYVATGRVFLLVLAPYAAVVLLALGAYAVTGWEHRYLASALVLGPFTLARPWVAGGAASVALARHPDLSVAAAAVLALAAVLLVEPVAGIGEARRAEVLRGSAA